MVKQKNINKKEKNNIVNIVIIIGIVFLIGSLILMFIKSDKTDNYIKEVSYSEYLNIIKEDKYSIILLTSPTCSHCNSYKPFVNYLASEYNLDIYNIDLNTVTAEEYYELHDKYSALKNQYIDNEAVIPTPTTIIAKNGAEVASITGDIGYNGFARLLKSNQVIK